MPSHVDSLESGDHTTKVIVEREETLLEAAAGGHTLFRHEAAGGPTLLRQRLKQRTVGTTKPSMAA